MSDCACRTKSGHDIGGWLNKCRNWNVAFPRDITGELITGRTKTKRRKRKRGWR